MKGDAVSDRPVFLQATEAEARCEVLQQQNENLSVELPNQFELKLAALQEHAIEQQMAYERKEAKLLVKPCACFFRQRVPSSEK